MINALDRPQLYPLDPAHPQRDLESLVHAARRDGLAWTSSASTQHAPSEDDPPLYNDASLDDSRLEDTIL